MEAAKFAPARSKMHAESFHNIETCNGRVIFNSNVVRLSIDKLRHLLQYTIPSKETKNILHESFARLNNNPS